MIKTIGIVLFTGIVLIACSDNRTETVNSLPVYSPESPAIHDTVAQLDSILFYAYNHCEVGKFADLVSEDLEFYHDQGGLETSKAKIVDALQKNICGKVNRELLPGSIEVYPIPGFGAIEMGWHRFHNLTEKSSSRYSKFVHTWHRDSTGWKLSRVISLH